MYYLFYCGGNIVVYIVLWLYIILWIIIIEVLLVLIMEWYYGIDYVL